MDISKWDWGTVPAWLGALSLILAFTVFRRDRLNAERGQIDLVGAWSSVEYERSFPDKTPIVEGTVTAHIHNGSQLPVRIVVACYKIESNWLVPDLDATPASHGQTWAFAVTPGTEPPIHFPGDLVATPQTTTEVPFRVNVEHMAPAGAEYLAPSKGIWAKVEWLLVIDNAGRRWEMRPEQGGRAKRVRSWWRPKEHMPRNW